MRKEIEANKRKIIEDFEKNKSKRSKMEMSTLSRDDYGGVGTQPNLYSSKSAQNYRTSPHMLPGNPQNKFEKTSKEF